ncbi:hypothetical protein V3N99_04665 [Dermatophilaceae bacterium Soc4.6]
MSTPGFARDLIWLSRTLEDPVDPVGHDLVGAVTALEVSAADSVTSYLGLSLVLQGPSSPGVRATPSLTMSTLPGSDGRTADDLLIGSSLLLPLRPPAGSRTTDGPDLPGWDVDIVLYASNAGAFVDLAADLAWLAGTPLGEVEVDQHLGLGRTDELQGSSIARASSVDQAMGALLAQGLTPEKAAAELLERAAGAPGDLAAAAERLLSEL